MSFSNAEQQILQKHLASFLIHDVFNQLSEDDILDISKSGEWSIGSRVLTNPEVLELKAQATKLLESKLWRLLSGEITKQAHEAILKKAGTESDLIGGKIMMFNLFVIESVLKKIVQG